MKISQNGERVISYLLNQSPWNAGQVTAKDVCDDSAWEADIIIFNMIESTNNNDNK